MPTHTVISDWVVIDAPQHRVWNVLLDFQAYPQWNSFTSDVQTELKQDSPVVLQVHLPKRGKRVQHEFIRAVQPPHTLAWGTTWGTKMGATFLLQALRTQSIEPINAAQCRYRSTDKLSGILTPLVKWIYGESIRCGFNTMAHELKQRAEALHQESIHRKPIEGVPL